ncbi:uncharacterized protein LOC120652573 [Panicum virgatum]|uniref:uncharacterized protein LOC120652573 n=1 Tax=Panicum virgatum TaxID=38727 RepID=UPI0019D588DB|nr:uncharacterized protein LOC120652573 [Panicum virgatum]
MPSPSLCAGCTRTLPSTAAPAPAAASCSSSLPTCLCGGELGGVAPAHGGSARTWASDSGFAAPAASQGPPETSLPHPRRVRAAPAASPPRRWVLRCRRRQRRLLPRGASLKSSSSPWRKEKIWEGYDTCVGSRWQ